MSSKHHSPDMNIIAGTIDGLNNYLFNFTQSVEQGSEYASDIYTYSKKALLNSTDDLNRYAVPKGFFSSQTLCYSSSLSIFINSFESSLSFTFFFFL
jgi:hypothetical protein